MFLNQILGVNSIRKERRNKSENDFWVSNISSHNIQWLAFPFVYFFQVKVDVILWPPISHPSTIKAAGSVE